MVVFTIVQSVERIIYAIFHRFNEDWRNCTLELFYTGELTAPSGEPKMETPIEL
jgi:hypothetical protein